MSEPKVREVKKFDLKVGDYVKYSRRSTDGSEWAEHNARYYKVVNLNSPRLIICKDGLGITTSFMRKEYTVTGELTKTDAGTFFRHNLNRRLNEWEDVEEEIWR